MNNRPKFQCTESTLKGDMFTNNVKLRNQIICGKQDDPIQGVNK